MFELETRYQEYGRLLLFAECLEQRSSQVKGIRALEEVRHHIGSTLQRGRNAKRSVLLDRWDEVLTSGSPAAGDVRQHLNNTLMKANGRLRDRDCKE